jgi:hypothetical protein
MAEWQPAQMAQPMEWVLIPYHRAIPIGVIRRLEFDGTTSKDPDVWYRAVTYSDRSEHRELIGYARTFEAACRAAFDYELERQRTRHAIAAVRAHERPRGSDKAPPHIGA